VGSDLPWLDDPVTAASPSVARPGQIPKTVAVVVGDVVGSHMYSHHDIDVLFVEAGEAGDRPSGNCAQHFTERLLRCNTNPGCDSLEVLGTVLRKYMEHRPSAGDEERENGQARIRAVLERNGLLYLPGGHVTSLRGTAPTVLAVRLETGDLRSVAEEFQRALSAVDDDPAASVTAACATLESVFKVVIEDEGLEMPKDQSIGRAWNVVRGHLGLDAKDVAEDDLKKVLQGMASTVDGIGSLRTHAGSAHGRGRTAYRIEPRHARLAVNAASTVAMFVLERWDKVRNGRGEG
jgi:hypothetical protein